MIVKKRKRKVMETAVVVILCIITLIIAFFSIKLGRFVSLVIFGLGFLPVLIAYIFKISIKKILPDIIFGLVDNILLIIPAIVSGYMRYSFLLK
jgi:hypothetical protein